MFQGVALMKCVCLDFCNRVRNQDAVKGRARKERCCINTDHPKSEVEATQV